MIEIEIPKDIKDFEPKFVGPFTVRQTICFGAFLAVLLGGYFIIGMFTQEGIRVLIPLILSMIPVLFGWYKPYGMKFEAYVVSQIFTVILPPKKRLYKIENEFDVLDKKIEQEENLANKNKNKNKNKKSNQAKEAE